MQKGILKNVLNSQIMASQKTMHRHLLAEMLSRPAMRRLNLWLEITTFQAFWGLAGGKGIDSIGIMEKKSETF